jgi:hypothetical protein
LTELVCKHVYDKFGDKAWMFLDEKIVITIDTIRRLIGKPITINTWWDNGRFSQRGLRCNICSIPKGKTIKDELHMSAHCLGIAVDFNIEGLSDGEVHIWIAANKDKLPYNMRIERDTVGWTHLDCYNNGNKLTFFTA